MTSKKRKVYKGFNPEKYTMIFCPSCGGTGKLLNDEEVNVCSKCGGFGLVKKEEGHK
jgi:DnaJ-class molecular chaperone